MASNEREDASVGRLAGCYYISTESADEASSRIHHTRSVSKSLAFLCAVYNNNIKIMHICALCTLAAARPVKINLFLLAHTQHRTQMNGEPFTRAALMTVIYSGN
jgi:hypothetical protein